MLRINEEWMNHLLKKHLIISEEIHFFRSAVSSLSGILEELIVDMIIEELTWDDIGVKYHISRTMIAKRRKKAIRELELLYNIHDRQTADYILS